MTKRILEILIALITLLCFTGCSKRVTIRDTQYYKSAEELMQLVEGGTFYFSSDSGNGLSSIEYYDGDKFARILIAEENGEKNIIRFVIIEKKGYLINENKKLYREDNYEIINRMRVDERESVISFANTFGDDLNRNYGKYYKGDIENGTGYEEIMQYEDAYVRWEYKDYKIVRQIITVPKSHTVFGEPNSYNTEIDYGSDFDKSVFEISDEYELGDWSYEEETV